MSRFFPDTDRARAARAAYAHSTLVEALAVADESSLERPGEFDVPEMLDELARLFELLDVPDRDGVDFAVIVPVLWNGATTKTTISLDFGRRLLSFTNHPQFGTTEIPPEIYLSDLDLPANLRRELLTVLITYKNPHV